MRAIHALRTRFTPEEFAPSGRSALVEAKGFLGTRVLDGYRGIAVVLVLIYHTYLFSWFAFTGSVFGVRLPLEAFQRTGYLGVELFFAISGFVLFLPHARRAVLGTMTAHLGDYARRRAFKIVPSYALVLVATMLSMRLRGVPTDFAAALWQHVLFIQNFYNDGLGSANSVFWSLGVEAQFYVLFPILAVAFRRSPIATFLAMTTIALGYRFTLAKCCLESEPIMRQVPAFLDVFAAGMLAAYAVVYIRARFDPEPYRIAATVATSGALAIGIGLFLSANTANSLPDGRETWNLAMRSVLAVDLCVLFVCSCFADSLTRAAIANPLLRSLSTISYNVYLWHTLILIYIWQAKLIPSATADPHQDPHWQIVYMVSGWSLVFAVSTAVTYFIERPILSLISPQSFSFPWRRFLFRAEATHQPVAPATSETGT